MAQKTIAALSLAISTQTAEFTKGLKGASGSMDQFKKGVTNASKEAKKAFGDIAGGIGQIDPAIGQLVQGIKGAIGLFGEAGKAAKGFAAAFISTGIGAVIVALGGAFLTLSTWINRTTEGADQAKTVWAGVTAVFEEILDRISILGSAIAKFVTGDFKGAASEIKRFWESVKAFGDDVNNSIKGSVALQERENQLRKDKIAFITREKELIAEISELRRKAQDSEAGFTSQQQLGFIQKAIQLQKQLGEERRRIAQEEADIQSERIKLSDSNYADLEKEAQLRGVVLDTIASENNGLRELLEKQKTLTQNVEREAAARQKILDGIEKQKPKRPERDDKRPPLPFEGPIPTQDLEESGFKSEVEDLTDTIEVLGEVGSAAFNQIGEAIGLAGKDAESFRLASKKIIDAIIAQGVTAAIAQTLKGKTGLLGLLALPIAAAAGAGAKALFSGLIPSFATGGIMPYSGVALVGEQGPELVRLPAGSQVINNSQTKQMLGGGTQNIRVEVYGTLRGSDIYLSNKEEARRRGTITG